MTEAEEAALDEFKVWARSPLGARQIRLAETQKRISDEYHAAAKETTRESNFAADPVTLSLTHHTFLVGPWKDAGEGAVLVTQLDDEDEVVLILKPGDVAALIVALDGAQR